MKKASHKLLLAALLLSTSSLAGCLDEGAALHDEESALRGRGQHCTQEVTAHRIGDPAPVEMKAKEPRCYDTFSQAIAAATHGTLQLPAEATPELLDRVDDDQKATLAAYVTSIEYVAPNWNGFWGSHTYTSNVTCDQGYTMSVPNLVGTWLDNVISSVRTFPGCANAYHYEHPNFAGAMVNCPSNPEYSCYYDYHMGAMNDRTSSIRWTN